ncbi:MAG: hypothetical protein A3A13_03165 [Candidatus Yanofskybacteria bacterium RIFCSPLOWO2_01_FULL_43_22]|uniref:Uncharacterized protein n=1 Tax=Candidatus Yanofskybacteria bacterium RIFCSPLOWO2_01_FULL_43_22 TaxID=1802695 RepID=A0A1F8GJF4_9BACT|nr:MAG: hypothetical protein A3A13_03165 [Candidatus Yanofskybacteria bacterium RIFCSPLOWO2_01_FULL_43_22]
MVTAKSLGATGAGALNKFGKGLADGSRSWIGRNTLGRGASWADDKLKENKLFNEKTGRFLRSFTTTKLAESKYGGGQSWQDEKKLTKEVKAKRTEIEDKEALNAYINRPAGTPPPIGGKLPEQVLRGMTREQKGKLSKDLLTNPEVLRHLSAEDFNHILDKSEKSDADKVAIKGARSQALRNATNVANFLNAVPNRNAQENEELRNARTLARDITGKIRGRDMQENISPDLLNEPEVLRALSNDQIKELPKIQMVTDASAMAISQDATERAKGKALLKALVPKIRGNDLAAELDETVLANQNVVESMTKGQIKDLEDAVTDRAIRARIGVAINTAGAGHPAHSYINDQRNNANWI